MRGPGDDKALGSRLWEWVVSNDFFAYDERTKGFVGGLASTLMGTIGIECLVVMVVLVGRLLLYVWSGDVCGAMTD